METKRPCSKGVIAPAHLRPITLVLLVVAIAAMLVHRAEASMGYELDAAHPSVPLAGLVVRGLAVDQGTGDIYVAIASTNLAAGAEGEILRFNSNLSADGTFASGGGYYTGVALNPLSSGFLAAQAELHTVYGNFGISKLDRFDSSGSLLGSFPMDFTDSLPPIVTDSAGHIYFPNATKHSVQIYSSAGSLLEEVTCTGCPSGAFGLPGSVALDAAGNLYVADTNPDRVVKLVPSGGSFAFSSLVQSGRGAGAVAIDPGSGDILVADMPGGNNFHVVAYDSSGTQFDDFGAGMFPDASSTGYGALSAYQMAVNGITHRLYVGSRENFYAFEKTTISPPSATVEPASAGQLGSRLNSTVNANGHAVLDCEFEYTSEGDFLTNGFSNASSVPCSQSPVGANDVQVSSHVSGLSPSSPYRYRITVINNGGSVSSADEAFETLPELPPLVTTEAAQAVTQSTATLSAKVNPRGGAVSNCHFELGMSISYGTNLSCLTPPNEAATDVSETRSLTGLAPATTYHYRLVVTTNAGTAEGDDVEFTTASPPSEPEPEGGSSSDPTPMLAPAPGEPSAPVGPAPTPPATQCKKGFRHTRVNGRTRCVKVCPKGFRRKLSRGKVRCVRKKHPRRSPHRHHRRAHR